MVVYQKGIHIAPVEGQYLTGAAPLTGKMQSLFIDYVQTMLNAIAKLPLGKELLTEISNSGKTVTIYKSDDAYAAVGPTAMKAVMNVASDVNKMVKSYRPLGAAMEKALSKPVAGQFLAATPSKSRATGGLTIGTHRGAPPTAPAPGSPQKETIHSSELTRIFDRASVSLSRKQIAVLIGVSEQDLLALEEGAVMDNNTHARIGMVLYDFLTPGPGIDTVIRFAPILEVRDDMAMGHELIHAWRMMTGRRIFQNGWEEEAMTTGFPPFANFKYTENKLRIQAGTDVRSSYNNPVVNSLFLENSFAQGCGMHKAVGQS